MNGPRTAGSFAVWGGLFSAFDCTLVYLRQKEDPWNSILAGAATGGLLQLRRGFKASAGGALMGGMILAFIEGLQIAVSNRVAVAQNMRTVIMNDPMASGSSSPSSSLDLGWFGGKEKKQDSNVGGGSKTEILESFDAPLPTFEFK